MCCSPLCDIADVTPIETGTEVRDADDLGLALRDCCWLPCLAEIDAILGDMTGGDGFVEFVDDLTTSGGVGRLDWVKRDDNDGLDDLRMCTSGFSALLSGGS